MPKNFLQILVSSLTLLLLGSWQAAGAYDWESDYGANLNLGRDNNFRLTEKDQTETSISTLGVFANLAGNTEISELRFTLSASANDYSESDIEDSNSESLAFAASRRGERLTGSVNLSFNSQSTTETELLDTGSVLDGSRDTIAISPRLAYDLSERSSLSATLTSRDVTYDTVSLTEYKDNSVSLGWHYQIDETSDFSVSLRSSQYDPEDNDSTDTNGIGLAYNWRQGESIKYRFSVGYSDVERPQDSESGGDFLAAIDYEVDERNGLSAELGNDYVSSGAGEVRDEDFLRFQWVHSLSVKMQLNLTADAVGNDDRDYVSIQLETNYQYTREIGFGASLRHRQQSSDFVDADSTSIFISLSYSPI